MAWDQQTLGVLELNRLKVITWTLGASKSFPLN